MKALKNSSHRPALVYTDNAKLRPDKYSAGSKLTLKLEGTTTPWQCEINDIHVVMNVWV